MIQRSVSNTHDAETDGKERLYRSESSREMEARIVIETRRLLIEVRGLEDIGDERQLHIDFPGGGGRKTCGAGEGNHVDIRVALEQLNGCSISGGGLSSLRHADGNVENVTGSTTHGGELQFKLEKLGVRKTLSNTSHDAGGGRNNAAMNAASSNGRVRTTLQPIVRIIIGDDSPLTRELPGVMSLSNCADATRNGREGPSVLHKLGHGRGGGTDGTGGRGNLGRVVLHVVSGD